MTLGALKPRLQNRCPRCDGKLYELADPCYGDCLNCGEVFIAEPLRYIRTLTYKDSGRTPKETNRRPAWEA